jgi:predicted MFS family arabinose efflux permease
VGAFDSLRYRDYRRLWAGAVLSNTGTWMQFVGLAWYVFELTHSAFWVSFVTFVNFLPTVLSPVGGVYSDRIDRRTILLAAQALMMVLAAILAVLVWVDRAGLATVLVLTFGQGVGFAFNGPAWQSYLPNLVPPEAIVNAIALNSAQFSLARVIGPAIGGALILASGPALVFGINAVSFVAVLVALTLIRARPLPPREPRTLRDQLVGGLLYTWRHRRIRAMLAAVGVQSFFVGPVTALLPIYAAEVYGRGASGYGALTAATGLGSVVGALILGRLGQRSSPMAVAWCMAVQGLALLALAAIPSFGAGLALLTVYGAGYLFGLAATNSDIQLQVDEAVRGRVVSLYMVAVGALYPIGSLLAGVAADTVGLAATTVAGAAVCLGWGLGLARWWRGRAGGLLPAPEG